MGPTEDVMISRWTRWFAIVSVVCLPTPGNAAEPFTFGSPSAVTRSGDMKGRIVETRDGEELGRIHDFAVDLASGRIAYVAVSVGSFLIQDSLIAVAPDALRESADADGRLVLEADANSLRNAQRFSQAGAWPERADVVAAAGERDSRSGEDTTRAADAGSAEEAEDARPRRGTATISDGNKTATLSAGERSIRFEERPGSAPAPQTAQTPARPAPTTRFERLDSDGNGVLNRAEIAHELTRRDSYSSIDLDGNGTVDTTEFNALLERRAPQEEPAPPP
jgi:sporulation protein YlmC with PRC-barrel domain